MRIIFLLSFCGLSFFSCSVPDAQNQKNNWQALLSETDEIINQTQGDTLFVLPITSCSSCLNYYAKALDNYRSTSHLSILAIANSKKSAQVFFHPYKSKVRLLILTFNQLELEGINIQQPAIIALSKRKKITQIVSIEYEDLEKHFDAK